MRALRGWRRTRPFWAGALLMLAGIELLVIPLAPWTVLFSLGLGGIAAVGIGCALVAAGLFLWFLPNSRHYVGIHAVILSVLSFAASNLGGFLIGMLLGIAGGAMGFAWTPGAAPTGTRTPGAAAPQGETALDAGRSAGTVAVPGDEDGPDPEMPDEDVPDEDVPDQEVADRDGPVRDGPGRDASDREAPGRDAPDGDVPDRGGRGRGQGPGKALAVVLPVVLLAVSAVPRQAHAAAPGRVVAGRVPTTVTTSRFAPRGFTFARVAEVPTVAGPRRVMVLSMEAATLTRYRLRTHDGGDDLALDVADLRLTGHVTLYLTRFSGCVQGVVCLTFRPETLPPPPVTPPFVFMTNVVAEQALVTSDTIVADGLRIAGADPPGPPERDRAATSRGGPPSD
ncbi:DUF6114 domain-containing protein [Streptomyces cinnamoneus]|uniref:DUF6114 domain-containing protein n=1 Tax=Streptomyces cinnamoneus TaxID=53446 RepID=UPI001EFDB438|nr:DUF6114 domain-containing protein [Streptomyces cinnamoneus]